MDAVDDYNRERLILHHNITTAEEHYRSNELKQFPGSNPEIMSMFHHMGENNGYKASFQGFSVTEIDLVGSFMSYFNEESSELQQNQLLMVQKSSSLPNYGDKNLMVSSCSEINNLKIPKSEPLDYEEFHQVSNNFERSEKSLKNSEFHDHHNLAELPNLQSHHYQKGTVPITESDYLVAHQPSLKRFRSTTSSDSHKLQSMISENSFPIPESNPNYSSSSSWGSLKRSSTRLPQNIIARQKRKIISDKTSYLQKLMPWDRKMDMATMLEEAYKYIKFLQAQVSVLQSMPCQSSFITPSQMMNSGVGAKNGNHFGGLGGLEKLNRQQLLQVLVNSPVAQSLLYSQECCVYSLEQLILLKNNILIEQMSAAGSSSSSSTASLTG